MTKGSQNECKSLKVSESEDSPALKHGAWSRHIRKRYSDRRTTEGKQLAAVIDGLAEDLGGHSNLSAAQRLILDGIRSKLIVIFQISKHVDSQDSIVNDKGELLPCLGRNYTTYAESLRRDLETLFRVSRQSKPESYRAALRALEGGKR